MDYFWASLFPVIAGFAAAIIADRKNRGGTNWGVASFILPILVFVVVFLSKISHEDKDFRGRVGIRKWIGIPIGLLFILAGLSLSLAEDQGRKSAWFYAMGLGSFLIWRSFLKAEDAAEETEDEAAAGIAEKDAPFVDASAAKPGHWSPSFANVLFSLQGRISRSVFWLRGAVPVILLFVIMQGGLLVGGGAILDGAPFPKVNIFLTPFQPSVSSDFQEAGDKVIGTVSADTGPAQVEFVMTAAKTSERVAKTVIVGGRTLRVTAAKRASGESTAYDVTFDWENYPAKAKTEKPATLGQLVFLGVQITLLLVFLWMLFAIAVKRFHDHDRSGWWSVLGLIPILGQLGLLISLGILKGKEGDTRFGPDPLQSESVA